MSTPHWPPSPELDTQGSREVEPTDSSEAWSTIVAALLEHGGESVLVDDDDSPDLTCDADGFEHRPDGSPMSEEEKAADSRRYAVELSERANDASDPTERRFYREQARRCEDEARRFAARRPSTTPAAGVAARRQGRAARPGPTRSSGSRRSASTRSSAASGDSGDPPGEPPALAAGADDRRCECGCGKSLAGRRADAVFFNPSCRKRAERARKAPEFDGRRLVAELAALTPTEALREFYALDPGERGEVIEALEGAFRPPLSARDELALRVALPAGDEGADWAELMVAA